MLVESIFMPPCELLYFIVDSVHLKVPMDVTISHIPSGIYNVPQHFVLKLLDHVPVTLPGTTPQLDTISPYWSKYLLVQ